MKTLQAEINKLVRADKDLKFNSFIEQYLENERKYLNALLTHSELTICDLRGIVISDEEIKITSDNLFKLITYFRDKSDKAKKGLDEILSKIKLDKVSIHSYDEFDRLEICVSSDKFYVKYKPKNVAVSFWIADAKDVKIND